MFQEEYESQLHRFKESFLLAAAKGGRLDEVSSLIEIGAEVDWVSLASDDTTGSSRDSPLLASVRNGHIEVSSLLLAHGANPHQRGAGGNTPLHLAAISGDEGLCNLFLGNTFGDGNISNSNYLLTCTNHLGKTPFDISVERGFLALAEKLKTVAMHSIDVTSEGGTLRQQQGGREESSIRDRFLTCRGESNEQNTSSQRDQDDDQSFEHLYNECNDSDDNSSWEHGQGDDASVSTCREQGIDFSVDTISLEHQLEMLKGEVETLNAKNL